MKTAEEWLALNWTYDDAVIFLKNIKQIQLDSYHAGMTKAAEIVIDKRETIVDTPARMALSFANQLILAARDKKETI